MKLAHLYLFVLTTFMLGAYIVSIEPKAIAYQSEYVPHEVEFIIQYDWTDKERVRQEIRKVFPESPNTFIRIAECESGLLEKSHNAKTNDNGIFQINEMYHGKEMKKLGLDANNVQDNLKFARILYEQSGTASWGASSKCWKK